MPRELLRRAIEQSEDRKPLVRAMVLLHGTRVLAAVDKNAARRAFAEGVTIAENLPLSAHLLELILNEAVRLGTAADPAGAIALFRRLPTTGQGPWLGSTGRILVQLLVQSGELEIAVGLLEDLNIEVSGAEVLIHYASDLQLQRRAMAAARERWRASRKWMRLQPLTAPQDDFYRLLSLHWRKLEPPDAENWLDEVLLAIETDPDQPTSFRFGERVHFHFTRDVHLFELLSILRAVRPSDQVDAILVTRPEVLSAAKLYPHGLESLMSERPPAPEPGQQRTGGFIYCGSGSARDFGLALVVMDAHRGDRSALPHLIREAGDLYSQDTASGSPNTAPHVFWPSCHAYKVAMYWAGKLLGEEGEPLLLEIPDRDFVLLSSIEFAAGALGVTQYSGVRMEHHRQRERAV